MHAVVASRKVSIGNLRLFEHDDVLEAVRLQVTGLEASGKTTMLFGWASMGIAVLIHEGATVLVVLNALRLVRFVDTPVVAGQDNAAG